jgi:sugar phosphate isomerase/epimerase
MNSIISTLGLGENKIREIIKKNLKFNYVIEFSSGGTIHSQKNWEIFNNYKGEKILHNYFPGYKSNPFVINLASQNKIILERSIKHCKKSIVETHKKSSLKFFGVHAGFYFDLKPHHLGNKIPLNNIINKGKYFQTFIESIRELIDFSKKYNVVFLIENNVLIKSNYFNQIPFIGVDSSDLLKIFEYFNEEKNHFGLLLDTAHLKVTSQTLKLNLDEEVSKLMPYVKAIHHSDNDGLTDSNEPFYSDYWFLKWMDKNLRNLPNTLEIKNLNEFEINRMLEILNL